MAFALADRLHKTLSEVLDMTVWEATHWLAYCRLRDTKRQK